MSIDHLMRLQRIATGQHQSQVGRGADLDQAPM
jgi:hypothetical protein